MLVWAAIGASKDLAAVADKPVLEDRYPERRMAFPGGVVGLADVTYSVVPGYRPLTMDIYLPRGAKRQGGGGFPTVLYVHGGGWVGGHTRHAGAFSDWPGVLASLAARGYVVASLNYRLSGEAAWPGALHDVRASLRYLRANAARLGVDRDRIAVWGGSAGGQLAAMAATTCGVTDLDPPRPTAATTALESACAQSAVIWYGVFDFAPIAATAAGNSPVARLLGCTAAGCDPESVRRASAVRFVDAGDPPMLLIHGASDATVAVTQSREFHAAMQAAGANSQLVVIPDVDHSFIGRDANTTRQASLQALQASFDFFDVTIGARRRQIAD